MLFDQPRGHLLCALRGQDVSFRGRDDGTLHQDVPGARELVGALQPGFLCQLLDVSPDPGEVADAGFPQRMFTTHFKQDVDERARLKVFPLEPVTEYVEDGEQLLLGGISTAPGVRDDQVHGPDLVAKREEGKNQIVLGRKVAVEGGLCHSRALDELIDADRADPAPGEQFVGGVQDAIHRVITGGRLSGWQ